MSFSKQFVRDQKSSSNVEAPTTPKLGSVAPYTATRAVPSVDQIYTRLNRRMCLSFPERRERLASLMKEKRNDLNNNDDDGDVEGSDNLDDKECERLMKSGLQALPLTATDQLMPCRMDVTEDHETKETIVGLKPSSMAGVKDSYDQEKENIDAAYLTQTTFDSVFSPVVRSHVKSVLGFPAALKDSSDASFSGLSPLAVSALSDRDLGNNGSLNHVTNQVTSESFDSSAATSFASATSFGAGTSAPPTAQLINGLTARRWSSLGVAQSDGLEDMSMSGLDISDASFMG